MPNSDTTRSSWLVKDERRNLFIDAALEQIDIQPGLPPAEPVTRQPAAPQIPQEFGYLNTPEGQAFVQKALTAPESLTPEEQQQWTATVNAVPELQALKQQIDEQAEQQQQEAAQAGPEWLNKGEREILGRFQKAHEIFGCVPYAAGSPYAMLAADVVGEMFKPSDPEGTGK